MALVIAMFLSPCMEIEAYFLLAGAKEWYVMAGIAGMYAIITLAGMLIWIRIVYKGLLKLNWHKWEHNAGIITGLVLIVTGIISFFINQWLWNTNTIRQKRSIRRMTGMIMTTKRK